MSTKRRYIQEANLISEQRYINNKFLMEAEDPTTPPATQTTPPATQPLPVSDKPVDLQTLITTNQIDLSDTSKNEQVLTSVLTNPNYLTKIPDIESIKAKVNTAEFLPELSKHLHLTFKPEKDKIDNQTIKGWEFGIGNDKFHADIVFDKKGTPEELGVGTHAHIGNKNIGLSMGMKLPHQSHDSDSHSVKTGYFKQGSPEFKVGVTIPTGNIGGHHKKSHGAML
jgi:hypothetical protein